jgi:hypothetical protein
MRRYLLCVIPFLGLLSAQAQASDRLPDEITYAGGHSIGFANGGSTATSDIAAVRANPAMLALEKNYKVASSYHWPVVGQDFFQVGVVDTKTSELAAGFTVTRPVDQKAINDPSGDTVSPLKGRYVGAAAVALTRMAIGLGIQHVREARINDTESRIVDKIASETTISLGVAALATPNLRFGLSAEGLGAKDETYTMGRNMRAGAAYVFANGDATLHVDFIRTKRIVGLETKKSAEVLSLFNAVDSGIIDEKKEKPFQDKANISGSVRVYELLRVLAGYGIVPETKIQDAALGLALVNGPFALSYTTMRPDLHLTTAHQSINLDLSIAM